MTAMDGIERATKQTHPVLSGDDISGIHPRKLTKIPQIITHIFIIHQYFGGYKAYAGFAPFPSKH
jgi:hypothetical protein